MENGERRKEKTEDKNNLAVEAAETSADKKTESKDAPTASGESRQGSENPERKRVFKKNRRVPRKKDRARSEFSQKILEIRRVTRVSAGGRRFSFSVALAAGDKKGKIGVGLGKAGDTSLAIEKAFKNAKKNMIEVKTVEGMSIPHEVKSKFNSAVVMIMPARGRGIIAGSAVRDLIELGGLNDINAKILSGSKNKLNIARATIKAFESLKGPSNVKRLTSNEKGEDKKDSKKPKKTSKKVSKK